MNRMHTPIVVTYLNVHISDNYVCYFHISSYQSCMSKFSLQNKLYLNCCSQSFFGSTSPEHEEPQEETISHHKDSKYGPKPVEGKKSLLCCHLYSLNFFI